MKKKVYLAIMDWYGNGDGVIIDSAWSSHIKAAERLSVLKIIEPRYSDSYVHTLEVDQTK